MAEKRYVFVLVKGEDFNSCQAQAIAKLKPITIKPLSRPLLSSEKFWAFEVSFWDSTIRVIDWANEFKGKEPWLAAYFSLPGAMIE